MGLPEFVSSVLGAIFGAAFGWALTMICSHPEAAQVLYWVSTVAFAMLGPIWALQAADNNNMKTGFIAAVSTVALSAAGLFWALSLKDACAT